MKTPESDSSIKAKNSPVSAPTSIDAEPVALEFVGHASSTSKMPTPAVINLMYCAKSPMQNAHAAVRS